MSEKNYGCIQYLDPIQKANEMTEILKKKEKCDVIICISHLGWNIEGTDDTEVIAASRHIDLVLGGHSHSLFQTLKYRTDLDGKYKACRSEWQGCHLGRQNDIGYCEE